MFISKRIIGKAMGKKGQVTAFILVGLVILIAIALAYFYSSGLIKTSAGTRTSQVELSGIFDNIKKEQIDRCIGKETSDTVDILLKNGGVFEPVNSLRYKGRDVTILCQAIPGKNRCLSTPLFLNVLEQKISERLTARIANCIDLSAYRGKNYDIQTGELTASATINPKSITVHVDYPVTLTEGLVNFSRKDFVYSVNVPLGELVKETNDVLNSEATLGVFEPLSYGLLSMNKYDVEVKKSYPNKIYMIGMTNSPYQIWFAVTGNDRFVKEE